MKRPFGDAEVFWHHLTNVQASRLDDRSLRLLCRMLHGLATEEQRRLAQITQAHQAARGRVMDYEQARREARLEAFRRGLRLDQAT